HAKQAAIVDRQPERAPAIFEPCGDAIPWHPGDAWDRHESIRHPAHHAGVAVDQRKGRGAPCQSDDTFWQAVAFVRLCEGAVDEARDSSARLRPDGALAILEH